MVKPQGRRGEVAAEIHTDFPERFAERRKVFALTREHQHRELQLEEFWFHKGRVILKFAGVDSISQAEELAGLEIQVPSSERAELEPGSTYVSDLVGCRVTVTVGAETRELGQIVDVQFGAGEAPLLVIRKEAPPGTEFLVPFAEPYLEQVDTGARRVVMVLPEGMLELDAPLSRDEKDRQQGRG